MSSVSECWQLSKSLLDMLSMTVAGDPLISWDKATTWANDCIPRNINERNTKKWEWEMAKIRGLSVSKS